MNEKIQYPAKKYKNLKVKILKVYRISIVIFQTGFTGFTGKICKLFQLPGSYFPKKIDLLIL